LRHTRPDELLALLIQGFLEKVPQFDPAAIDDVDRPALDRQIDLQLIVAVGEGHAPVRPVVPDHATNAFGDVQALAHAGKRSTDGGWRQAAIPRT
jgi:hypothetical protein